MFLLINKAKGPTSHDVVNALRKLSGEKRIGHGGTLDPLAEGLLIIAIGRESTKKLSSFLKARKEYEALFVLGKKSTTYDSEGEITDVSTRAPSLAEIRLELARFLGQSYQTPPLYSAVKISGKAAYKYARAKEDIVLPKRKIEVYSVDLIKYQYPYLSVKMKVSSGTYIRTIAHDLGKNLGVGAYLGGLKRTAVGGLDLSDAVSLERITIKNITKHGITWTDLKKKIELEK